MTYSAAYNDFCQDKYGFFSDAPRDFEALKACKKRGYKFVADNHLLIEQEFMQLFSVLQRKKSRQTDFWLYCYYCCEMLLQYYQAYGDTAKISEYKKFIDKISPYCQENAEHQMASTPSFVRHLGQQLAEDVKNLAATPLHVYRMRDLIGFLNVCRLYWAFCRMTITSALKIARDAQWIERLNQLLSKQINVDKIIKLLEAPNAILRSFSVGFFVARFILNAAMVLKHTFLPSIEEKQLNKRQRFKREIAKRHATFLNDMVWGTVNTLTNYAPVFHIAAPVAAWITAGFLTFDVALLLWRRHLEEKQHLIKKAQYEADLSYYIEQLAKTNDPLLKEACHQNIIFIRAQKNEEDISRQTKNSFWLFNAVAAFIFFSGFTASLLFSAAGILVMPSYAVCMIAASMYLTAGSFASYREKDLRLTQARIDNADDVIPLAEYTLARNQFFLTITKQIVVPGVLIASWFICWQAALALTALYVSYELYNAWSKHHQQAQIVNLEKQTPVVDDADSTDNQESLLLQLGV